MKILKIGKMAYGKWYKHLWPHGLLLESSVREAGYQQYRWLKFFICIEKKLPPVMSERDKAVIRTFAATSRESPDFEQNKSRAVEVHRRNIPIVGVRGTMEQDFMAEIDNPCPDYALREMYRKRLLKALDDIIDAMVEEERHAA